MGSWENRGRPGDAQRGAGHAAPHRGGGPALPSDDRRGEPESGDPAALHMYTRIHVCTYVYKYIIYIYVYTCICIAIHVCVCMYRCINSSYVYYSMHIYVYIDMYVRIDMPGMHIHLCARICREADYGNSIGPTGSSGVVLRFFGYIWLPWSLGWRWGRVFGGSVARASRVWTFIVNLLTKSPELPEVEVVLSLGKHSAISQRTPPNKLPLP